MTIFGIKITKLKSMNEKFNEIDNRFNQVDKKIEKIDNHLNNRLRSLEKDMTEVKMDLKILINRETK